MQGPTNGCNNQVIKVRDITNMKLTKIAENNMNVNSTTTQNFAQGII